MNEWEFQLLEDKTPVERVSISGVEVTFGDTVRFCPGPSGDIFDIALAGKVAIVESVEKDYDGKMHVAVVVEDDPGQDLGMLRQPGHRFFLGPEEIETIQRDVPKNTEG